MGVVAGVTVVYEGCVDANAVVDVGGCDCVWARVAVVRARARHSVWIVFQNVKVVFCFGHTLNSIVRFEQAYQQYQLEARPAGPAAPGSWPALPIVKGASCYAGQCW